MKGIVKNMRNNMKDKNDKENENKEINNNEGRITKEVINHSETSSSLIKNENKEKNKRKIFIIHFFFTHISLLFIPLTVTFLLQVVYLYLLSYVGTTTEVHKQLHYLIYCLVQAISSGMAIISLII